VHPAGPHRDGTLSQALARHGAGGGDPWRPGIVHRLDKDTSGLLVVAKNEEAHRRLKAALAARGIVREYLALVEGRPPARSGTIDAPLGRDRRARTRMSIDTDKPRAARTHFVLEEGLPDATLLRVRLETGRTHQIRVHFKAIGHSVCGDREYGTAGLYGLERQFLHAARLELVQPFTAEALVFDSPLPEDLSRALAIRRLGSPGCPRRLRCSFHHLDPRGVEGLRPAWNNRFQVRTARRAATHQTNKGALPWLSQDSRSCWRPECTSATRRAAGTPRCAAFCMVSATASTSSTC